MEYRFGERSLKNLENVHPNLVKIMVAAITDSPVDFTITEGLRSKTRQQELYAQGRFAKGPIVTYKDGVKKLSNHQDEADGKKDNLGSAVDLYPFFLGQVQVNHKDTVKNLKLIAAHIKKVAAELKIGITWGGDWKNPYDPPHFELKRK